ncbi:beta-alanine-activating enzyme-like [Trichomycterus rosablanca]|uniref:beta-alanine-activating enzyme-like n=1 Tax=Trichomycterus rosablanca TaxID=2290929 RepID=UPI002F35FBD4
MALKLLHEMVREAALEHGDRKAVVWDSSQSPATNLTYQQLLTLGNDLCTKLQRAIREIQNVIGVYCDLNILLPAWILGILQWPAAYVPLDPASPPLLTMRMMEKCHLKFCLIQSSLLQQFLNAFSRLLSIEVCATWSALNLTLVKMHSDPQTENNQEPNQLSAAVSKSEQQAEQLAYVLHTSGTTGLPKIVKVPHKCIVPNIVHLRSIFQVTPEDVVFLASPLTFDPSVVEMFLALSSGACLLMVPTAVKRMPGRLAQVLFKRNTTTILQATPTLVRRFGGLLLKEEVLSARSLLRVLALGGEPCPSLTILKSWRQEGNKTCIFNLYGTTEVSCWACCYELPDDLFFSNPMTAASVPLGEPLRDTVVEVRDERGCLVTEGEGQIFIGGRERVCLLDDEICTAKGVMRATGDWAMVQNSQLYYLGRKDRLVKRHGQQVHLNALQQALESLPEVDTAVVSLHDSSRLVAFVVPTSNHRNIALEHKVYQEGHVHNNTEVLEDSSFSSTSLEMAVSQGLSQLVPSHCIPDTVLLVPELPLTNHGKVAMEKLMRMYERQREISGKHTALEDVETVRERLQTLWKECLGLPDDVVITEDAHFMLSGGDSLQALRLFDHITLTMRASSTGLLEVILDGTFSDVLKHITTPTQHNPNQTSSKRQLEDSTLAIPAKRYHTEVTSNINPETPISPVVFSERGSMGFVLVRRAGEVIDWNYSRSRKQSKITEDKSQDSSSGNISTSSLSKPSQTEFSVRPINTDQDIPSGKEKGQDITSVDLPLEMWVCWSSDTGRCVDASPVLLVRSDRAIVFIGSHSHRLQALDLSTGEVLWERVLGGRLESSAAVSKCGNLVAVGCYDGQVYFLHADTGETCWMFKTEDTIKSSPTVDSQTGLVIVGSHDGHVYALQPQMKQCVWKYYCEGGAVFSSPCVHSFPRRLYAATLRGQLHCLNPDSGKLLWKYCSKAPFFSSPCCSVTCVCIGSVSGNISALNHDGSLLWEFVTDGPVFSSPSFVSLPSLTSDETRSTEYDSSASLSPANQAVVCGSHDGSVYCLNSKDGSILWRFQTTGKVYSSPFVFDGSLWGTRTLVAAASTDGTMWILDGEQGTLKAYFVFSGELFSSPIVWGRNIVVGCRNDYVYCLELSNRKERPNNV